MTGLRPFRLMPAYHERVWGGHRLKRCSPPVGEAWLVDAHNLIADGPFAGVALADLAARERSRLLGTDGAAACSDGFPLIIKLLDTADWISVQVHPDDCLAEALEGPGATGKTEAWHIIDALPGAGIVTGVMLLMTRPEPSSISPSALSNRATPPLSRRGRSTRSDQASSCTKSSKPPT